MDTTSGQIAWRARGLIFENCACTLVCPGHMHFSQLCTHARCKGYWAFRFDDGMFGDVSLAGVRAVIAYDTPQRMIDGGWTQSLVIDPSASADQRQAIASILTGRSGGPWQKLASFVATQRDTEFLPIVIEDAGATKRVSIRDRLTGVITNIRGRDRFQPVVFDNCFNQIHAPRQVLALGDTDYDDGVIVVHNTGTHGLASMFEWIVEAPSA